MANVELIGLQKLLSQFNGMGQEAEKRAEDIIKGEAVDAIGRMVTEAPVDTGNLRRNIKFEEIGDDIEVKSEAFNEQGKDYAPYVEFGTRFTRAQPYFWHNVRKAQQAMLNKLQVLLKDISE